MADMGIIYNGPGVRNYLTDAWNEYDGKIGIKHRGSSSLGFPKKQYGIETRSIHPVSGDTLNFNASIFDWPSDNDYVLYAPYSDKTLMRNSLTYELGRQLGDWAPRTKFCEMVLNGEYMGVFVFMERIKQASGRVDIDKLEQTDIAFNELTGGYIVRVDRGTVAWTSPFPANDGFTDMDFVLDEPVIDSIQPVQQNYIQTYITDFEAALDGPNYQSPTLGYRPYIDLLTFQNYFIMTELAKDVDGYRLSTFFYKEKDSDGGKLKAGPLWDFNLAWGNADYCNGGTTFAWAEDINSFCGGNPVQFWWDKLHTDPYYADSLQCHWQNLRQDELHEDSIHKIIDDWAAYLDESQIRNYQRWPVLGIYLWPNYYVGATYQDEIDYMKQWVTDRLTWMDINMFGSCVVGVDETQEIQGMVVPNPTNGKTRIKLNESISDADIRLVNLTGQIIMSKEGLAGNQIELDLTELAEGVYHYVIEAAEGRLSHGKIIKQ